MGNHNRRRSEETFAFPSDSVEGTSEVEQPLEGRRDSVQISEYGVSPEVLSIIVEAFVSILLADNRMIAYT